MKTPLIMTPAAAMSILSWTILSLQLNSVVFATQLSSFDFSYAYPGNLRDNGWPVSMPLIQQVVLRALDGPLPQEWCSYAQLSSLDLSWLKPCYLPDWLSGMTQLKSLVLTEARFKNFPLCLLHLSQLSRLLMNNIHPAMMIPKEVASMQCLKELDWSVPVNTKNNYSYSLDSNFVCWSCVII